MLADLEPRRIVITATPCLGAPLHHLLARELFTGWKAEPAGSLEEARFLLQHHCCDVLLLDESVYRAGETDGLAWITRQREVPVVLLADLGPGLLAEAMENGVLQWLPRTAALEHPLLLAAALNQAAQVTALRRRLRRAGAVLHQSRRQVDQLVGLLWRTLPVDAKARWHSQRFMMERLHEEVDRARRYGEPLTLVLGEMGASVPEGAQPDFPLAEQICKAKRVSDVAGQYGPNGFMLLLVHTPESGGVAFCGRLQKLLSPSAATGYPHEGRLCLGQASFSPSVATSRRLLSLAEKYLETAKTESGGLGAAI